MPARAACPAGEPVCPGSGRARLRDRARRGTDGRAGRAGGAWIIRDNSNEPGNCRVTQDELKALVGQAALQYVVPGEIVGVGTGSTVNKFIEALATMKDRVRGAVSSSVVSTERLRAIGVPVFDANEVGDLAVYIDGADEIDAQGYMIK